MSRDRQQTERGTPALTLQYHSHEALLETNCQRALSSPFFFLFPAHSRETAARTTRVVFTRQPRSGTTCPATLPYAWQASVEWTNQAMGVQCASPKMPSCHCRGGKGCACKPAVSFLPALINFWAFVSWVSTSRPLASQLPRLQGNTSSASGSWLACRWPWVWLPQWTLLPGSPALKSARRPSE